jgi:hypothetical protein
VRNLKYLKILKLSYSISQHNLRNFKVEQCNFFFLIYIYIYIIFFLKKKNSVNPIATPNYFFWGSIYSPCPYLMKHIH